MEFGVNNFVKEKLLDGSNDYWIDAMHQVVDKDGILDTVAADFVAA
jgi:hypothetical protein